MLPVLKQAARGETRVPEMAEKLAEDLGLTPEERDQLLPSGRQKVLHNRIHWAKFSMARAGLIDQPKRGRFIASEQGRELLARSPSAINVELLFEYPAFREFYRGENADNGETKQPIETSDSLAVIADKTPEEPIEAAHIKLQSALREELLQRILLNSPGFFEQVIVELLVAMGYGGSLRNAASQLGRSGDGGVDGVVNEDRLGLDRVYVQAKRCAPTICRWRSGRSGLCRQPRGAWRE